jgi:nicotinamide-nucleotide amidase
VKRADAWVLTIGDELLRGEIVDSNKSFLSERLLHLDLVTERHASVLDDPEAIAEILREAASRARVVLVSGGLGPTRDDLTTEVAARAFGRRLLRDAATVERLRAYFASVGREMSENNAKQADFPEGAEILPNPLGTAPGFALEVEGARLFFMPGVPRELYRMVDEEVLPRIERALGRGGAVRARLLRTFGLGESILDRELSDLARGDADVTLGFRTQFPDNLVRVVARAPTAAAAEARLEALVAEVRRRLGDVVLGEGERPLPEIVGALLLEHKRTLALAESCTGGLLASRLTDVPGSSAYLLEAAVTYSNRAKVRALGVAAADLAAHGSVSEPVARQMAEGVRERAGADIGIGITGIAGPTGGTPDKPVGTVYIAYADGTATDVRRYQLMRERARNKELSTQIALDWIRRRLLGLAIPDESFPRLRAAPGKVS